MTRRRRSRDGEVDLASLSEALATRVKGMSAVQMPATGPGRQHKDAESEHSQIDGLWEQVGVEDQPAVTKPLTVRFEVAQSADTMTILSGTTFKEAFVLTPLIYRLLAGGHGEEGERSPTLAQRFTVISGKPGTERISTDRAVLAALVSKNRPVEMERAGRLLDRERLHPATLRLGVGKRAVLFADRWATEKFDRRLDAAVSRASSRTVLLMTGRDHVALWIRQGDLVEGTSRILEPDLAAAILKPPAPVATRPHPMLARPAGHQDSDIIRTIGHGSGPERVLLIDLGHFRKVVSGMPTEVHRDAALAALDEMVSRSVLIGEQRIVRFQTVTTRERRRA